MLTEEQKQQKEAQDEAISHTVRNIKHRIIVLSGKGGVGKTTVSVNLATLLQNRGNKTGLLDADVTGPNVPKMLGLTDPIRVENGKLMPLLSHGVRVISVGNMVPQGQPVLWRGPMRSKLLHQVLADADWGSLDCLVADLPPGTGDEVMTMAQRIQPDLAVIVTTPQAVSLVDSERAINMAKTMGIAGVGVVENMSGFRCPSCGATIDLFGQGGGLHQAKEMNVDFLGALPLDIDARITADSGLPVVLVRPDSDIVRAMIAIACKIEDMLEINSSREVPHGIR